MNIILTGATGYVGEGVLLSCLRHPAVMTVLLINRKPVGYTHPKIRERIVPDFTQIGSLASELTNYDACFFCAGISASGKSEAEYTQITYELTLQFAQQLLAIQPRLVFIYVSGQLSDSTEQGRMMWARVKGKTENALLRLAFRRVYMFRPGMMKPVAGQRNLTWTYRLTARLYPLLRRLFPSYVVSLDEVGRAMINSVLVGYDKSILEIDDIRFLADQ